jgi:hypothetical protein
MSCNVIATATGLRTRALPLRWLCLVLAAALPDAARAADAPRVTSP